LPDTAASYSLRRRTNLGGAMKINIGLSDQDRKGVIDILNVLLADEYILYTMTRGNRPSRSRR
jgi:hypothetical protein